MKKKKTLSTAFALAFTLPFLLSACSDDDPEPTPTPSPVASAEENIISLVCPEPLGTIDVSTAEDQWAPGYVVGTDQVLDPIAFGEITFTDSATGETHTDPAVTKAGADTTGAVTCTFTDEVEGGPAGEGGTVTGTVTVVERK